MPQLFMWFDAFSAFNGGDLDKGGERGPVLGILIGAGLGILGWLMILWLVFH